MKNRFTILLVVGAVLLGVAGAWVAYSKGGSAAQEQYARGYQTARQKYDNEQRQKNSDDLLRLRVCINKADTKDMQTSCFRKYEAGALPPPSIEDTNQLPDYL